MRKFYIIMLSLILLPCASVASDVRPRSITVRGHAEQEFNPDIASFSVQVLGKSTQRKEAKETHDKMLRSLQEIAKKYKIDDKDLSTGFSSVNPNYEYPPNGKRRFVDYSATTEVNIKLKDLTKVGELQDSLVAAGFENFQGPNYALDKIFTYNDKILADAVENARQKAVKIAEKLGDVVDKALEVKEGGNPGYIRPQPYMPMARMAMAAESVPTAAAQPSGVINIQSDVEATFSLK